MKTVSSFKKMLGFSVFTSGLIFSLTHSFDVFFMTSYISGKFNVGISGIFVIILFLLVDFLTYFVLMFVIMYIPAIFLERRIRCKSYNVFWYIVSGVLLGLLATPIMAEVSYFAFIDDDAPSFFQRYINFVLPMGLAGVAGVLFFVRCVARNSLIQQSISDRFS